MLAQSPSQNAVQKMAAAFIGALTDYDAEFLPPQAQKSDDALEPELEGLTVADLMDGCIDWGPELFPHATYKALYGGRAGAKSNFFAELMLANMLLDKTLQCVVIRKYRAAITSSAQLLLKTRLRIGDGQNTLTLKETLLSGLAGEGTLLLRDCKGTTQPALNHLRTTALLGLRKRPKLINTALTS
jgi:hypothetical protein